jgi:hypothetical protein
MADIQVTVSRESTLSHKILLEPLEKSGISESKDAKDDSNNFFGINKKLYRKSDSFQNPKT